MVRWTVEKKQIVTRDDCLLAGGGGGMGVVWIGVLVHGDFALVKVVVMVVDCCVPRLGVW